MPQDQTALQDQTVYIVDDDQPSREAVAMLVNEMGVQVETFESAEAFLKGYQGARPACLVTDVRMLQMSGLELQEELVRQGISLSVVVLTAYASTALTIRAIKGGAITLLEKPCKDLELWDAIRTGLAQDVKNCQHDLARKNAHDRIDSLTESERKVLDLIVEGFPNKMIAKRLELSIRTIEMRRQIIYKKLNADSVAELVRTVLETGEPVDHAEP